MELREYWRIVRRHWWLPALATLVALVVSSVLSVRGATAYRTDMRLAVSTIPTTDADLQRYYDPIYYSNLNSEYLADDLSEFLHSDAFATEVHRELNSTIDVATIVNATRTKKTHRFIDVTVTTPTAEEGQQIAGSISRIVSDPEHLGVYLKALTAYKTQISVVTPPDTHRANTPAGIASEVGLRTLIGLIVGIALAFAVDYIDPSIRTRGEAETELGLPVLGVIPRAGRSKVKVAA